MNSPATTALEARVVNTSIASMMTISVSLSNTLSQYVPTGVANASPDCVDMAVKLKQYEDGDVDVVR